jgi:hypothetical protein
VRPSAGLIYVATRYNPVLLVVGAPFRLQHEAWNLLGVLHGLGEVFSLTGEASRRPPPR